MKLRAQIKKNARDAMRGSWGKAAAIILVFAGVSLLFTYLEQILFTLFEVPGFVDPMNTPAMFLDDRLNSSWPALVITGGIWLIQFVLFAPLMLGAFRWFYRAVGGEHPPFAAVFEYYGSAKAFGKAVWLRLHVTVRAAAVGLVVLFPALCLQVALRYLPGGGSDGYLSMMYLAVWALSKLVLLLSMLLWFYFALRYFLCYFLLAEQPDQRAGRLVCMSVREMREYKGELFTMFLTLIPWALLCLLVIPALWAVPYGFAVAALYARIYISRAKSRRDLETTRVMEQETQDQSNTETGEGQDIESDC